MGNTYCAQVRTLPRNVPASTYHESDSNDSGSTCPNRASTNSRRGLSMTRAQGSPSKARSSARRLQRLVTSTFGASEPSPAADVTGGGKGDVPAIPLPQRVGLVLRFNEDTERTRLSQDSCRIATFSATARLATHRAKKSVAAYQHIIDDVRAELQHAPEKPVDPRWRFLLPFQPRCLRHQVLSVDKDCTQVEGAIAFVDISG
eukprot:RCo032934